MTNKICFNETYFFLSIIVIILIIIVLHNRNKIKIENMFNSINETESENDKVEEEVREEMNTVAVQNPIYERSANSMDRIYNPLRYPYKSDYFYNQRWYPNLSLPPSVIGGGYRRSPTMGGTEVPIMNPMLPVNISDDNIAPVNISTRGPLGMPQQMGNLYKVYGDTNDVLPLFGRRRYPNGNEYNYYTIVGNWGSKIKVITKNKYNELGNNDVVFLQGFKTPYRVSIFETDFPQYIPYI